MSLQRIEITGTIGGFPDDEVKSMEYKELRDRGGLKMPIPLSEQAEAVRNTFEDAMNRHGNPERTFHHRILLDEAFPNLLIHGLKCRANLSSVAKLTVEIHRTGIQRRVVFLLSLPDHEPLFDVNNIPDPTTPENLEKTTGRGVMFIQRVAGSTIQQIPFPGGKVVTYAWEEEFSIADGASERSTA